MDKRIAKTRTLILDALTEALEEKPNEKIVIGDILEKAHISRSTFYAHYKSIDDLVLSVNKSIFDHVFSHTLKEERSHDFSKSSILDYQNIITHTLYHLHDEKRLIKAILSSRQASAFIAQIHDFVLPIASLSLRGGIIARRDLPEDLQTSEIAESFIVLIHYWFKHDCEDTPEKMTAYFLAMN
ncbi:MAG: TetR/AcrR family transcriptional regulator [Bacilli bacterium]|jgi:AcrR family transcriptional regulator|nr:TetR/AcrR family transcriptional regulator [Bacilli bacterium]